MDPNERWKEIQTAIVQQDLQTASTDMVAWASDMDDPPDGFSKDAFFGVLAMLASIVGYARGLQAMSSPQHSASLAFVKLLLHDFQGLRDGETDVNGADLVEAVGGFIQESAPLLELAERIEKGE